MRADPFGIDIRENSSSFDANKYDVNEQHHQVEMLRQSSNNLVKKP